MVSVTRKFTGVSGLSGLQGLQSLGLSINERRPVRFHGRIKTEYAYPLRRALQTLGEVVWSNQDTWISDEEFMARMDLLDPVITVHPDRLFFEAFSQDQSSYGLVIADRDCFEPDGVVACGTTNVDFTQGLYRALSHMRTSRTSWFRVGPDGFDVSTDAVEGDHHEEKIDLPTSWVRGFLQLQGAMAMPGTRVRVDPLEVQEIIAFLGKSHAYNSPRSMRFEFEPGHASRVVLEPWEETITFPGTTHNYTSLKKTRIWGRKRLKLLRGLLPWVQDVEIYLKGRALPSFWVLRQPGITFILGMSGWTGSNWTQEAAFDLLTSSRVDPKHLSKARDYLRANYHGSAEDVSRHVRCSLPDAHKALSQLCRLGEAMYDIQARDYRHRELFEDPIREADFYPPNPKRERAEQLATSGKVRVTSDQERSTERAGHTFVDRVIDASVDGQTTHIVLKDTGQIIFARCDCAHFQEHMLNQGPCEHMLAIREHLERRR